MGQILSGNRGLPYKRASDVLQKLDLSATEQTLFMESFLRSKTNIDTIEISKLDERFMLDESYHNIISQWEHYAVLDLFDLDHYQITPEWISYKLEINRIRAEVVINNLQNCGLLYLNDKGEFLRSHEDIKTTEDVASKALKKSHLETLEIGKNKLEEIEVELRDFSSATVALDLSKLPEAKTIIREFRQKMSGLLRDGKKTDVFQLAIQFYPLTKVETIKGKLQ